MRLFNLFLLPVILLTGSIASAQQPSSMKLHARPQKITGDWASSQTNPQTTIVTTGGGDALPVAPLAGAPLPVAPLVGAPSPGTVIGAPMPGAVIGAPVGGPVHSTSMGQCGAGGCGTCGATCDSCGRGGCLVRIKEWFCSRPLHACDKQVCYDPVPPLYQFFPCPREGYCPRLAPAACCPQPVRLVHPVCSTRRTPWCDTSCGSCASTCGTESCGTASCGTSSCGSCSSCESGRSWLRFFSPLRCSSCKDHCCTPSAQCFTGQVTSGCASGNCGPTK